MEFNGWLEGSDIQWLGSLLNQRLWIFWLKDHRIVFYTRMRKATLKILGIALRVSLQQKLSFTQVSGGGWGATSNHQYLSKTGVQSVSGTTLSKETRRGQEGERKENFWGMLSQVEWKSWFSKINNGTGELTFNCPHLYNLLFKQRLEVKQTINIWVMRDQ